MSRVGGLLSLSVLIAGLSACGEPRRVTTTPPRGAVQSVGIRADVGMVEVVHGRRMFLVQELHAPNGAVERTEELLNGHLQINVRCKSPVFCHVDTRLEIPDGVPVSIELERGEVWATGVGELDIELGTGILDLEVTGPLRGRVGKGTAKVETSAGHLVRLAVGQGDIDVVVPKAPFRVDIQASEPELVGIEHDPGARGLIELTAPSGRVRVRSVGDPVDSGSPQRP